MFADRFSALFVLAFILRRFWTADTIADVASTQSVKYREVPAGKLLSRNLLIYGLGGLAAPFIFVKLIDMLLVLLGLA